MDKGVLYVCPTPIGNLEDITIRALNVLKTVDLVAAEDTRHTIKLLNHYGIKKPLTSYHEHNKKEKGPILIERLLNGENIAIVSDAGMPGISDPGEDLIRLSIENGIDVVPLPGATAFVLALVVSGFSTEKFVFHGFLPSNRKERLASLKDLEYERRTIILYEAPHRLLECLKDIEHVLGNRDISISRELTKKFEETFRGTISEAYEKFKRQNIRGEFVIVIRGSCEVEEKNPWEDMSIKEHIKFYISQGFTKKEAVKKVALDRDMPKREIYKDSIDI